jgi:DNA-directed RNA polymerase specialized sigma24 family protein
VNSPPYDQRLKQRPRERATLSTWLYRIVVNVALMRLRARAMWPQMWIKRGDRFGFIEELRIGDELHVQAFERARAGAEPTASLTPGVSRRDHLSPASRRPLLVQVTSGRPRRCPPCHEAIPTLARELPQGRLPSV